MNILIVDDDIVDRTHIKRTLRRSDTNCKVSESENVDEALKVLANNDFDAILVDYNMPQRNGLELLHEIKNESVENGSAIIMMSTSEEEELAMQCLHEGAQDFIAKSDITGYRLRRAILGARARFAMEQKLKESYQKVKQMAEQDELTKLANRYLFDESLKRSIENNSRRRYKVALILFDLDHFKYVNDTHGHDVGDVVLKKVVNRIHTCLRGQELFSRLGGDEFAIVLNHIESTDEAEKVAIRILRVLEKPFEINGIHIDMAASIGVAFFPDNAENASEIFKRSDMAMYKAKHLGRNQIVFYEESMQDQFLNRYKIENELKSVEALSQMALNFQPLYDGQSLSICGFETLLRWNRPGKPIFPDEFIPIAEDCKMINPIGKWVTERALSQIAKWRKLTGKDLNISINLSPVQLTDPQLIKHIKACLAIHQVPAAAVEFEITETALLAVSDQTKEKINEISELGCCVALDDFGTGYSSISHLQDFPIDTVKIDKSLMPKEKNNKSRNLIRGLASMLQYLDLNIVAEGIEDEFHLKVCQELNINRFQGYFLAKPMSVDNATQLLKVTNLEKTKNLANEQKHKNMKTPK